MSTEREELMQIDCPCCTKKVTIKINKNGLAYFNCFNGLDGQEGYCGASQKWSKAGTEKLRRQFEREKPQLEFEERKSAAKAKKTPPPEPKDQGATSFLGN